MDILLKINEEKINAVITNLKLKPEWWNTKTFDGVFKEPNVKDRIVNAIEEHFDTEVESINTTREPRQVYPFKMDLYVKTDTQRFIVTLEEAWVY